MFTSSLKREAFSRRSCAKTGKEMYVQSCCFAYKIYCFLFVCLFVFWRSRCRPRRWILKSLMTLLSTITVLFKTTFTRTIKLNPLLKLPLGSNLSHTKKKHPGKYRKNNKKYKVIKSSDLYSVFSDSNKNSCYFCDFCDIFVTLLGLFFYFQL